MGFAITILQKKVTKIAAFLDRINSIRKILFSLMRFTTNQPFFPKNGIVSENLNFTLDFQSVEVNGKYQIVKQGSSKNESYISNHHSKITINGGAIKDSKRIYYTSNIDGEYFEYQEKKKFLFMQAAPESIKKGGGRQVLNFVVLEELSLPDKPNKWKEALNLDLIPLLVSNVTFHLNGAPEIPSISEVFLTQIRQWERILLES